MTSIRVKTGLETLLAERQGLVRGARVGLISNPTGVTAEVTPNFDTLLKAGVNLVALFGPEHGFDSHAEDGLKVASGRHRRTGLPVYSLYGETRQPTPEMLQGIDLLLFDIQDVGVRFYTYIWTMALCMQAAAQRKIPFVVLDRPNPITGVIMEGPLLEPEHASFVGLYPILLRHGLTIGELGQLLNAEFGLGADLTVVPMQGWRRDMWFAETGLPWVAPSPNIPTLDTTIVYPGACLIEGTTLSEGRGTTRPFELVGAPWLDGETLADRLNQLKLPGVRLRAANFTPSFSKYAGEVCYGVQYHVIDRTVFRPVITTLHLIAIVRDLHPDHMGWALHFPEGPYPFERLVGNGLARRQLEAGTAVDDIVAGWAAGQRAWEATRQKYLVYPE